jgi:hypothetical protein
MVLFQLDGAPRWRERLGDLAVPTLQCALPAGWPGTIVTSEAESGEDGLRFGNRVPTGRADRRNVVTQHATELSL